MWIQICVCNKNGSLLIPIGTRKSFMYVATYAQQVHFCVNKNNTVYYEFVNGAILCEKCIYTTEWNRYDIYLFIFYLFIYSFFFF